MINWRSPCFIGQLRLSYGRACNSTPNRMIETTPFGLLYGRADSPVVELATLPPTYINLFSSGTLKNPHQSTSVQGSRKTLKSNFGSLFPLRTATCVQPISMRTANSQSPLILGDYGRTGQDSDRQDLGQDTVISSVEPLTGQGIRTTGTAPCVAQKPRFT